MKSVNDILAPDWFAYMDYLSGGDNVIHYSWKRSTLSRKERNEIRSVLNEIDDLTGLSFAKTKRKNDDLRFIYTEEITDSTRFELDADHTDEGFPLENAVVGRASARKNRIKIFVKDNDDIVGDKGASVHFITEQLTFSSDGGSAFQTLQLQMLGAFAQFERTMIRKRQAEGIAKAKAKGVYAKRKRTVNPDKIKQLFDDGLTKAAIAKQLNISRMSVYRSLQGF